MKNHLNSEIRILRKNGQRWKKMKIALIKYRKEWKRNNRIISKIKNKLQGA